MQLLPFFQPIIRRPADLVLIPEGPALTITFPSSFSGLLGSCFWLSHWPKGFCWWVLGRQPASQSPPCPPPNDEISSFLGPAWPSSSLTHKLVLFWQAFRWSNIATLGVSRWGWECHQGYFIVVFCSGWCLVIYIWVLVSRLEAANDCKTVG